MTDQCPYLEYRPLSGEAGGGEGGGDGEDTDHAEADGQNPRAYCTAAQRFVQPMRADVCNDRYGLDHQTDCEIYRDHEGLPEVPEADGDAESHDPDGEGEEATDR